jgi:hypothetical protein
MGRAGWIVVAQVTAAVLAVACVVLQLLSQIMRSSIEAVDNARVVSLIVIIVATGFVVLRGRGIRTYAAAVASILTLGAGVAPAVIDNVMRSELAARYDARQRAELAAHDAKALGRIERRTRDVETRLAEKRVYSGQDALNFVDEVSYVDLKYLGLPDRSGIMLALLGRALAAKLIDPNVLVKGPRPVDVNIEPLFLHYYRADIRPYPNASVRPLHWEVFKLLVASGADLALAPGHPIAEDLRKGLKPDQFGNLKLD